jgi:hypothetical protein
MTQNTSSRVPGTSTVQGLILATVCLFLTRTKWSRISGPITQKFWLTQNHEFRNFWNLHKLAVSLKTLVTVYQECTQEFRITQNTNSRSRVSGTSMKCLFLTRKQLVQKFWTNHTEILADTKPRIPEFLELAQIGCQSQNTSYRISGMYTGVPYHPKHQFQIQSIWNVHEMSVFDSKTTGPELLDQSHRFSG